MTTDFDKILWTDNFWKRCMMYLCVFDFQWSKKMKARCGLIWSRQVTLSTESLTVHRAVSGVMRCITGV